MKSAFTQIGRHVLQDSGPRWRKVITSCINEREAVELLRLLCALENGWRRRNKRYLSHPVDYRHCFPYPNPNRADDQCSG
jgi:hypothetical protein